MEREVLHKPQHQQSINVPIHFLFVNSCHAENEKNYPSRDDAGAAEAS